MLRVPLAALHLLALAIGFTALVTRADALRLPVTEDSLRRAFRADSWWGGAAALWIGTGLWRYLASMEKSTSYYNHNDLFRGKMGLLVLILALEAWPMITLIRWRMAIARNVTPRTVAAPETARRISAISFMQVGILVVMIFTATAMARGYGAR